MSTKQGSERNAASRLSELKDRVERATKLIAELREKNYSLTGELAELKRKVKGLEGESRSQAPSAPAAAAPATGKSDETLHEEIQVLRDERKIIRAKVQNLLERIEKLDL